MTDPLQRNQPALTTSSGLIWLVAAGILAAIAIAFMIPLGAIWQSVVVTVLYLGMLGVRFAVPPGRVRLGILAGLMLAIAAVALASVFALAVGAASAAG